MVGIRVWVLVLRVCTRVSVTSGLVLVLANGCAGKSTGDDDAAGDADHCLELCGKSATCPSIPASNLSCNDQCLQEDAVASESQCYDLYLSSLACSAKLADVCTALVDCKAQIVATSACEQMYCSTHQSSVVCVGYQP